jgi:hypothetical protein
MIGFPRQGLDRPRHSEMRGAQDVETVDFLHGGLGHGPENFRGRGEDGVKSLALGCADFFRVGQTVEREVIGQDHGGRYDRTRQRTAPRLVDAGDQNKTASAQGTLAAEVAGHWPVRDLGRGLGGAGLLLHRGGGFAFAGAEIIQFGAAHGALFLHLDFGDAR